jgi:glucoamylase
MNLKRWLLIPLIILSTTWLLPQNLAWAVSQAPDAPGNPSVWSNAQKQGIGTSYEQYVNHTYQEKSPTHTVSKVWFSLSQGIVTETAFGQIDQAQLKDLQFLITGNGFVDEERVATDSTVDYLYKDGSVIKVLIAKILFSRIHTD